ncbi:MAG: AAA family ATPase [Thermoguttaceae bacterium]|nr:AAA family ATPase [Thermoguttaceae bacterium]
MEYRENRDARKPFLSTPDSRVYFPAAAIEEARRSTTRCLRRNEGVALVVGATGTGKTLLTRVLAAEFEAESLVAVVSPTRRVDAKSFWQQFLFSLRQTFCGCDETELRLMALDYLERSQRRRCVLLIDDAQNLPFRVFDELRSFVDQGAAASSQICVALFGTVALEERLNLPPLYPFQQRIVSRSYLDAFESAEIADYIDCETRRVDGKFVFTTDAKRKVADLCKGSPRIANQLCDRALFLTAQKSGKKIEFADNSGFNGEQEALERIATESVEIQAVDASLVERAWANLLNLPEETPRLKNGDLSEVVEFGTLEDDEEENDDFAGFDEWEKRENCENDAGVDVEKEKEVEESEENNENNEISGAASGEEERAATNAAVVGEISAIDANDKNKTFGQECEEFNGFSEFNEFEGAEEETNEEDGEIDATLEARLLQNLKIWEDAKENNGVVAENSNRGDRWERADALKEQRNVAEWKETAGIAETGEVDASFPVGETSEVSEIKETSETKEARGIGKTGETSELGEDVDSEKEAAPTEERVFEALKSEYFNEGFLFELDGDGAATAKGKKAPTERERKAKTRAKSTSKTRRPIVGDDDGSRLWNLANGRSVDGETSLDDERFLETQLTAERVAKRVVSDEEAEADAVVGDWDAEFRSLEDRAYEQILEDCWETTENFEASDEYLSELSLLEQEIEEEANLIRRIRSIHLKLRSARAAAERKRRRNAEETTANAEKSTIVGVKLEDETLNY